MNKISPIDIRVAVLTHPLMNSGKRSAIQDQRGLSSIAPLGPSPSLNRVGEIFHTKPKSTFEIPASKRPPLLRKGEFFLINMIESIKFLYTEWAHEEEWEPYPTHQLQAPSLPYPSFTAHLPARYFWHPAASAPKDEYAPACLMSDTKEAIPQLQACSPAICKQALPQKGVLRKDGQGFVYLELPSDLINQTFPLLNDPKAEAVCYQHVAPSAPHIPVMTPKDYLRSQRWGEIQELDQEFSFEITGCYSLEPNRFPGIEKVYFLKVKSRELEALREKYNLTKRILSHDFHIVIATQKQEEKKAPETFRLNVSCFAA